MKEIRIISVTELPEIQPGDDLGRLIAEALRRAPSGIEEGDILVVAQKVVSKAEGRIVRLEEIQPSPRAVAWAEAFDKDARVVEVVLRESARIVKMERGVIIAETRHGFICANAGVDASNAPDSTVVLLPEDPDRSAAELCAAIEQAFGVRVAVIVADTFGRPWREGLVNVALGVAGLRPLIDYRGRRDSFGRELHATVIALADELASAAELVMGKSAGVPVAIIRGACYESGEGRGGELIRPPDRDLFR